MASVAEFCELLAVFHLLAMACPLCLPDACTVPPCPIQVLYDGEGVLDISMDVAGIRFIEAGRVEVDFKPSTLGNNGGWLCTAACVVAYHCHFYITYFPRYKSAAKLYVEVRTDPQFTSRSPSTRIHTSPRPAHVRCRSTALFFTRALFPLSSLHTEGLYVAVQRTNPDNPLRNIRVLMPGYDDARVAASPFHPSLLSFLRGYTVSLSFLPVSCVLAFAVWMRCNRDSLYCLVCAWASSAAPLLWTAARCSSKDAQLTALRVPQPACRRYDSWTGWTPTALTCRARGSSALK